MFTEEEHLEIAAYIKNKKLAGDYHDWETEDDFERQAKAIIQKKGVVRLSKINNSYMTA